MNAGPLAERPVTASMCFSSTTTVRPMRRRAAVRSHRNRELRRQALRALGMPDGRPDVAQGKTDLEQPLKQDGPDLPQAEDRHPLFHHRRYSSSRVAASVFASRYLMITGAYSEIPHRSAAGPLA